MGVARASNCVRSRHYHSARPLQTRCFGVHHLRLAHAVHPRPAVSGNVVLLSIDRETLEKLKREPEALDWAVVLQKLALGNPKQVVSFINPSQIQGSYDDLQLLADVAGRLPFQYGDDDLPKPGLGKLASLAPPFEKLAITPAPRTVDWTMLAKDGATRRLIYSYENQLTLHPLLAQRFNGYTADWQYSGIFDVLESKQMLIRYRNQGFLSAHSVY